MDSHTTAPEVTRAERGNMINLEEFAATCKEGTILVCSLDGRKCGYCYPTDIGVDNWSRYAVTSWGLSTNSHFDTVVAVEIETIK